MSEAVTDYDVAREGIRRDGLRLEAVTRAIVSTLDSAGEGLLELTGFGAELQATRAAEDAEIARMEVQARAAPPSAYKRKNVMWSWRKRFGR